MKADGQTAMERLQEFQTVAGENGYSKVGECRDGSTVWFKKERSDAAADVHKRLCIDSVTDSVTIFSETVTGMPNSKTFWTVSSFKDWFGAKST
jgi:hypothetical protein